MKKTKRLWALFLAVVMALGLITTAFAAPTIDSGRKASLSLYKYDITAASADGTWDAASYVSTGVQDDAVTDKLEKYAIQGVEFTYLRVASISTYSQRESGQYKVGVLYGFADDAVLQAIGLTKADAYKRGNGVFYFTSDKLNKALADALADNATTVKNALEIAVRNGGKAMAETDANGHSKVSGLKQGLYLVVETRVPENVTSTCNPFFVSLPMTTIDGKDWNYDVTVYPKNQTGKPTLEKTVREAAADTGKNGGTADIADGKGDLANVHFLLHNDTDGYFVTAELVGGVYYVTGHEAKESKTTVFAPNGEGHIRVMGLEDDTYTMTETATDKGYVLLKDSIEIIITAAEGESACETCGAKLPTASGSVNGGPVNLEDGNAIVPLTVINSPGFDLPKTGGYGTWMFTVGGCMLLGVAAFIVARGRKHNRNDQ